MPPPRSIIAGAAALGLDRRIWIPIIAAKSSSFSAADLLILRNPCRRFIVSHSGAAAAPPPISVAFLVDSCGLSPDSAAAVVKTLNADSGRKTSRNPAAVLELFRSRGFSSAQIARMVALQPKVLASDAERTLKPKMDYLRSEGFSQNDIARIVSSVTRYGSLEKTIKPNFDILRTFLHSNSEIVVAVTRSHCLLWTNLKKTILPNSEMLRALGVPEKRISQLVVMDARSLTRGRFGDCIEMLKRVGLSHTSFNYILGLSALSKVSRRTLQKKMSFFRKVGFAEEDFFSAFRGAPNILSQSEEKIKKRVDLFKGFGLRDDEIASFLGKKAPNLLTLSEQNIVKSMDFIVRTLECKPRDVLSCPPLLWYSLERRLIPRAFVRNSLISKGLLRGDRVYSGLFITREDKFINDYVIKFQNELPQLLEEYEKLKAKGISGSVSMEASA